MLVDIKHWLKQFEIIFKRMFVLMVVTHGPCTLGAEENQFFLDLVLWENGDSEVDCEVYW